MGQKLLKSQSEAFPQNVNFLPHSSSLLQTHHCTHRHSVYLPDWTFPGTERSQTEITLQHLLCCIIISIGFLFLEPKVEFETHLLVKMSVLRDTVMNCLVLVWMSGQMVFCQVATVWMSVFHIQCYSLSVPVVLMWWAVFVGSSRPDGIKITEQYHHLQVFFALRIMKAACDEALSFGFTIITSHRQVIYEKKNVVDKEYFEI